jgi:DNA-binding transcriptional LysR family regulator
LTFQKLDLFCRVSTLRSVTKAAESLGIAQPAVTAHLRSLEEKLSVRLVYRDGRNLALTEAGQRFHRWCEETLTRCSELSRELSGLNDGSSGTAQIAASMTAGTYALTDMIARYKQEYPHVSIRVQIGNTMIATEAARTGACDFAVLLLDTQQDIDGLEVEVLWEEHIHMIAAADDDRVGNTATPAQVAQMPFVTSPSSQLRRTLEDEMLYSCGVVNRNVVLELGHPEAIKRVVRQKCGFSFVEETAIREELMNGTLRIVTTPKIELKMPIYLVWRRGKSLSEMQIRLMNFMRRCAGDLFNRKSCNHSPQAIFRHDSSSSHSVQRTRKPAHKTKANSKKK